MAGSSIVSVIIPTYNRGKLLKALLESLSAQTYPHDSFEVIVVDNGSKDDTESIVSSFAKKASFKLSFYKKNYRGPSASRNFAAGICQGEIIAFIDSDCVALPHWLSAGVSAFRDDTGLIQGKTIPNPGQPRYLLEKTVNVIKEGPYYETCNIFYRKKAMDEVGRFSPEYEEFGYPFYGEDMDLAWKVKGAGYGSVFSEEALVYHHVFKLTFKQWLFEPVNAMTWPYIIKKFPVLRKYMYGRYFLFDTTAFFDLFLLGILFSLLHWAFISLAIPYVLVKYAEGRKYSNSLIRMSRIVFCLPRAAILFFVLLYGSMRFRSFLL